MKNFLYCTGGLENGNLWSVNFFETGDSSNSLCRGIYNVSLATLGKDLYYYPELTVKISSPCKVNKKDVPILNNYVLSTWSLMSDRLDLLFKEIRQSGFSHAGSVFKRNTLLGACSDYETIVSRRVSQRNFDILTVSLLYKNASPMLGCTAVKIVKSPQNEAGLAKLVPEVLNKWLPFILNHYKTL